MHSFVYCLTYFCFSVQEELELPFAVIVQPPENEGGGCSEETKVWLSYLQDDY